MRLLTYTTKESSLGVIVKESTGEGIRSKDANAILEWLMGEHFEDIKENPKREENTIRLCWSLDDTLAPVFKLLGKELCLKLARDKKCYLPPYKLVYKPGKLFTLQDVRVSFGKIEFFDLEQYFTTEAYQDDTEQIWDYGMTLYKALGRMGYYPKSLVSPAGIFEDAILDHCDIPTGYDMPKEAAEYSWMCSGKLWIECHRSGFWDKAFDYDMVSAFPSIASSLLDTRKCNWLESDKYQKKALYGYCRGQVTIYDRVMVSPIIYIDDDGGSHSAVGTWDTYLTKGEIDFINKWGIGKFRIDNGWWAIPQIPGRILHQPLKHIIDRLLEWKGKGGLESELAKRMSVGGVYGKLGQESDTKFGRHFSPCWFAEISTQDRLEVAEWLYRHNIGAGNNKGYRSLIHISVDGALLDKEVANGTGLIGNGTWKLSYTGQALSLSSGLVYLGERKPKGLYLDDIVKMINEHPRQAYYQKLLKQRVTLGRVAEIGFDKLGKEVDMHTAIDLNMSHDRVFSKLPELGQQLLAKKFGSKPLKVIV